MVAMGVDSFYKATEEQQKHEVSFAKLCVGIGSISTPLFVSQRPLALQYTIRRHCRPPSQARGGSQPRRSKASVSKAWRSSVFEGRSSSNRSRGRTRSLTARYAFKAFAVAERISSTVASVFREKSNKPSRRKSSRRKPRSSSRASELL